MSVPQDSRTRRQQKKRRTKKLARWREQQAQKTEGAAPAATPAKKS